MELLPAAQIIQYVAALERITIVGEQNAITDTVAKRVALLCQGAEEIEFEKWEKAAKIIYDKRSRLMHGDYSPLSKDLIGVAALAERVTRKTLLKAMGFYLFVNYKIKHATEKDLGEEFKSLERNKGVYGAP